MYSALWLQRRRIWRHAATGIDGYVRDTCCRHSCLVFSVLGERYIPRQCHPVQFRHLSSLMGQGCNAFDPTQGCVRGRSTQRGMWTNHVCEAGKTQYLPRDNQSIGGVEHRLSRGVVETK